MTRRFWPTSVAALMAVALFASLAPQASCATPASASVLAHNSLPEPVAGYPIGWCIRANKPQTFLDAKTAGYEFVELALQDVLSLSDVDFALLQTTLRETAPLVLGGYNPIPKDLALIGGAVDDARLKAHLSKLFQRAAALKLRHIIFNSGPSWRRPDGLSGDEAVAQLTAFSKTFAALAAENRITVLLQPVRSSDSNQLTTVAEALRLVEAVGRPNDFALMVDYSFFVLQKDDPAVLRAAGKWLRHVHIANPANNRKYAISDAESDYASFFAILKETGYRGGISVHGGPLSPETWADDTAKTITFLRGKAAVLAVGR